MAIALPSPDALPEGPHRDLVVRLHELYGQAGRPAARMISKRIIDQRSADLETVSHETISAVLRGRSVPSWAKLRSIIVVLHQMSEQQADVRRSLVEFNALWSRVDAPRTTPFRQDEQSAGADDLPGPMEPPGLSEPDVTVLLGQLHAAIARHRFRTAEEALASLEVSAPHQASELRRQLGFLDLPAVDRTVVAFLWSQLTTMRDDVGLDLDTADAVVTGRRPPDSTETTSPGMTGMPAALHDVLDVEVPTVPPGGVAEAPASLRADPASRCHVIFLNTARPVDIQAFAPELMRREAALVRGHVDLLVLLSMSSPIAAELRDVERDWEERGAYPFGVRLLGVDDVDGRRPAALAAGLSGALRRRTVLPPEWRDYLGSPSRLCVRGESAAALDEVFARQLPLRALDEAGALLTGSVLDNVRRWLGRPEEPTLVVLGDFGDGKTFFTYNLARRLCAEAARGVGRARVPVRLALAELRAAGSGRDLLRRRLEDLGIDLASWRRLVESHPTLVILDGFDEMSGNLSRPAIVENVELLRDCCEEFTGSKILVTSRSNVFGTADDQRQIFERIGRPRTMRLAPFERRAVLHSYRDRTSKGLHQDIDRLQTAHDPIGLATKPLYYDMIFRMLPRLSDVSFNEHILYERSLLDALHRKLKLLEDEQHRTPPGDLVDNLLAVLEQVAVDLQRTDQPYVHLKDLDDRARKDGGRGAGLALVLWRLRDDADAVAAGRLDEDATARIGIRSLLKRAPGGDERRWPVTFFHRSMREYLVARAVARAIAHGPARAEQRLSDGPLSPEIRHFATLILQAQPQGPAVETLLQLIGAARTAGARSAVGGNAISLLASLCGRLPGRDWSDLLLDHADLHGADLRGMSFRGSSLRWANLDNTDLTGADLRDADLSGVRLEETAAVTAVAGVGESQVFAAYSDGRIREWTSRTRDPADTVLCSLPFVPDQLWPTPGGALVAAGEAQIAVLYRDPTWRVAAHFPTQSRYRSPVWRDGRALMVAENMEGDRVAIWQSPASHVRHLVDCSTARAWAVDGDRAMAVASFARVTVTIARSGGYSSLDIDGTAARCVDVRSTGDDLDLILGTDSGSVAYLRLLRTGTGWQPHQVWRAELHQGPVESVSFLGNDRLLSGSRDRSIAVVPLHQVDGEPPANVVRLHVRFRCRGVRITGVRGDREHTMLEQLSIAADA